MSEIPVNSGDYRCFSSRRQSPCDPGLDTGVVGRHRLREGVGDVAVAADPDHYEAVIKGNEDAHAASGHWGVPTFVFENEPFFGQDRIDLLIWRMESKGLTRRKA